MCVEYAFEILKGRWRIIQKRVDVPLRSMANIVSTCIVLYNLCIITKDKFDSIWIEEAGRWWHDERRASPTRRTSLYWWGKSPDSEIWCEENNSELWNWRSKCRSRSFLIKQDERDVDSLREATMAHESIAKALWKYNLSKESTIQFSGSSSDFDAMEE
jgi:hypothetical protein